MHQLTEESTDTAELAKRYPEAPPGLIARLLKTCQITGWPVALAERCYLAMEREAEEAPPAFLACHATLLREEER